MLKSPSRDRNPGPALCASTHPPATGREGSPGASEEGAARKGGTGPSQGSKPCVLGSNRSPPCPSLDGYPWGRGMEHCAVQPAVTGQASACLAQLCRLPRFVCNRHSVFPHLLYRCSGERLGARIRGPCDRRTMTHLCPMGVGVGVAQTPSPSWVPPQVLPAGGMSLYGRTWCKAF